MGPDDPFPGTGRRPAGRAVAASGCPTARSTSADREHDGRDGYWVVTPLAGRATPRVPVVRGWAPSPDAAARRRPGTADVIGWLQPPEGTGDRRRPDRRRTSPSCGSPTSSSTSTRTSTARTPSASEPGRRAARRPTLEPLPEAGRFTALRNLLYAVEWWFFGAFAVFVWWRWCRDATAPAAAPAERPVDG